MSAIEILGSALGVLNVWLITRRSIWNWPVGIAMTVLYSWIFFDAKLYSDFVLQLFFTAIGLAGWAQWAWRKQDVGEIDVVWMPNWYFAGAMVFVVAFIVPIGLFAQSLGASMPIWDASILSLSVAAQLMLNFRKVNAWLLWIAVDLFAIPLYFVKGLYPTTGLYVVFLGLAIYGFYEWWKKDKQQKADDRAVEELLTSALEKELA